MRWTVLILSLLVARHSLPFLLVVRHGETDWNRRLRVQGTTDVPLNARGILQAERCAEAVLQHVGKKRPKRIYSSALSRASSTAAAIACRVGGAVCEDLRLNEWNLGVIEGMSKDEAAAQHADDWNVFSQWCAGHVSDDVANYRVSGGGESMEQVRKRAVECLEEACSSEDLVIAVTHGGVLGQLLRNCNAGQAARPAGNACISRFLVRPEWKVVDWASTEHLEGDAAPAAADYGR
ncbi:unnamed protein product [Effrenium voratum]|nr:unnamed protein product [Effrenium voratum]